MSKLVCGGLVMGYLYLPMPLQNISGLTSLSAGQTIQFRLSTKKIKTGAAKAYGSSLPTSHEFCLGKHLSPKSCWNDNCGNLLRFQRTDAHFWV